MNKKTVFAIVMLISAYVVCQAIADVGATKMTEVYGVIIPGGTLIFALTFTLRDLIHKRLGKEWARAAIIAAGLMNIVQAGFLAWVAKLPYPPFYAGEAWANVFAIVPAITVASIAAEVISELIDTETYHAWRTKFPKAPQWSTVLVSNAVSLPIDSVIFGVLAFTLLPPLFGADALPFAIAMSLAFGQMAFKAAVTVASMPLIYLVKDGQIV